MQTDSPLSSVCMFVTNYYHSKTFIFKYKLKCKPTILLKETASVCTLMCEATHANIRIVLNVCIMVKVCRIFLFNYQKNRPNFEGKQFDFW